MTFDKYSVLYFNGRDCYQENYLHLNKIEKFCFEQKPVWLVAVNVKTGLVALQYRSENNDFAIYE